VPILRRRLNGASPAELPVELPTKFELVINLQPRRRSASKFRPRLLARAEEVNRIAMLLAAAR